MNKELFVNSMNTLKKYSDWEHKLYELGVNFWEREEIQNLINSYIELLIDECHCEIDEICGSDIEYFIYETDWGKNADKYCIYETDENGNKTEYHLHTIEDLWDYLVKMHPEIEEINRLQPVGDNLKY